MAHKAILRSRIKQAIVDLKGIKGLLAECIQGSYLSLETAEFALRKSLSKVLANSNYHLPELKKTLRRL